MSKEQSDVQKAAKEFAAGEFDPDTVLVSDRDGEFPVEIWKKACELGFLGVHYPEVYGGQGLGLLDNAVVVEAFCRQESGVGAALGLSDFGAEFLMHCGAEDLKQRVLPRLVQGEALMTLAHLDEGFGLGADGTVATRDRDGYVIRGRKCLVPLGDLVEHTIVLCGTGGAGTDEQTGFLLEKGTEGLEVSGRRGVLGMRMVSRCDLTFTGLRVKEECVVGTAGEGRGYLERFMNVARVECGAMGVGIAAGALDRALAYSKRREQFGRPIAAFDAVKNRLADMFALVETARLVVYRAAHSLDQGRPDRRFTLMAKWAGCQAALRVSDHALQIHGGYGYMTEGHIERFYRDARSLDLFLEPGIRQRSLLADELLGKVA